MILVMYESNFWNMKASRKRRQENPLTTRAIDLVNAKQRRLMKVLRDRASVVNTKPEDLGGIDLNSANLDLQIKRDGKGVPLPLQFQDMEKLQGIKGFVPVIINIVPVTALPFLAELQKIQPPQAMASAT